ncbi:uncharacterized protein LOC107046671, partial [Diachasma alloeum]|uniref:uncharacterized protein LOC107046671 n=1 Tax=Diachasma alloeum TaxID=454923 RepID=UPI0007384D7B
IRVRSRASAVRQLHKVTRERDLLKEENAELKIRLEKMEEDIEEGELRMELSVGVLKSTVEEVVGSTPKKQKLITLDKETKLVHLPHDKTVTAGQYETLLDQKTFRKRVNKLVELYWPDKLKRDNLYFEITDKKAQQNPAAELITDEDLMILRDLLEALQASHCLPALDDKGVEIPWEFAYKWFIGAKLTSDRNVRKRSNRKQPEQAKGAVGDGDRTASKSTTLKRRHVDDQCLQKKKKKGK